jgi:hypothetical protein
MFDFKAVARWLGGAQGERRRRTTSSRAEASSAHPAPMVLEEHPSFVDQDEPRAAQPILAPAESLFDDDLEAEAPEDAAPADEPQDAAAVEALAALRREARAQALAAERRVFLSDAGGPGSLAEALNDLVQEGRVSAEFVDDPDLGPHILYRPALVDSVV